MTSMERPIPAAEWVNSFAGYLAGVRVQLTRSADFRTWSTEQGVAEVIDLSEAGEGAATVRLNDGKREVRRQYPLTNDGAITAAIHAEVLLRFGTLPAD